MYCAVFLLANGAYERDFVDELPTEKEIYSMEKSYTVDIRMHNRSYYNDIESKPAKLINLFKIGGDENE